MFTSTRSRNRALALAGIAVTVGLLVSGCSGSAPSTGAATDSSGTPEIDPLVVSAWKQNSHVTPFVAVEQGIAEQHGLNVEIVPQESATAGAALVQSGGAQIYAASYPGVIDGIRSGLPFRILMEQTATGVDINSIEAMPDSGIKDITDLEGKKVAVSALNSAGDLRVKYAIQKAGGDPSKVEFVALPFGEMAGALEQGTIDAGQMYGAGRLQAKDVLKTNTILDFGTGDFEDFAETGWVTTAENLEKYPAAMAAFQCSMSEAMKLTIDDDALYLKDTAAYLGVTEDEVEAMGTVNWAPETRTDRIAQVGEMMQSVGLIPAEEKLDIKSAVVPFPTDCD